MIADVDRYQGVVLREIILSAAAPVTIASLNLTGRSDAFSIDTAAIQIKHSSARLSPWQFTYLPDQLEELQNLASKFEPVWSVLVCGIDGVLGLSVEELDSLIQRGRSGIAWLRVKRDRHSMYRVAGSAGVLERPKPKGLETFMRAVQLSGGIASAR